MRHLLAGGSALIRRFATAAATGLFIGAALSTTALAAPGNPGQGAARCQPEQGQITASVAQTGQLGTIISGIAPSNERNQESLFNCPQAQSQP
jgi:hypothetical protein